jgi:hypothetical protein
VGDLVELTDDDQRSGMGVNDVVDSLAEGTAGCNNV